MPILRPEIAALSPYEVGRPIDEVVKEHGIDPADVVRLTANESPEGPFPGVAEAVDAAMALSNRYPDNDALDLVQALATELGVDSQNLLIGNGSVALISEMTSAVGGAGTNVVYGWPSFVMYRFAAIWAGSEYREIPLNAEFSLDLDGIRGALDDDTRVVFVCNPNNPTGTVKSADEVEAFLRSVPESTLVIVDEAYHDFVDDPSYRTAIPVCLELGNAVVLRTFSKIYSLAGHRIGYAVGRADTLIELRKAQQPLTVNRVAQAAALASLGQREEVDRRVAENAGARHHLRGALAERGLEHVPSQTNFIYFKMPHEDSKLISDEFTKRGVIIRPMSHGWMRVSIGSTNDNKRFLETLDDVLESLD